MKWRSRSSRSIRTNRLHKNAAPGKPTMASNKQDRMRARFRGIWISPAFHGPPDCPDQSGWTSLPARPSFQVFDHFMIYPAYPSRFALSRPMLRASSIMLALSAVVSAQDKTTFDDHIFPLFQQSCLNCHNPDKAKGGLDLSTYAATLKGGSGGKIVEPGDVAGKLVTVVLQTAEPKMPPEGDKLATAQVDLLKRWIEGGLLENKSSSARKATKPKFETALRSDPGAKPDGPPPMPADLLLEPTVLTSRAASVNALAASPWAPLLAVTGQRQVLLHHTGTLELVGVLPFPEGDPVSLAFTP
ncbi:MAG: hypothetical protein EOP88_25685, partial [Verrucomicrobiaceae bacterium]